MPEFGLTASTESLRFGATRNPWDTDRSAGGSSGGSAALVAAGVVPIAHANDGGGSIRIPAACCGLVGLKPSRGRLVDCPELARLPVVIGVQGVLTRSVRDTALYSRWPSGCTGTPRCRRSDCRAAVSRRLRVGLVVETIKGLPVSAEMVTAVRDTGQLLADLGHHVERPAPRCPTSSVRTSCATGRSSRSRWVRRRAHLRPGFDGARTEAFTRGMSAYLLAGWTGCRERCARLRRLARDHEAAFASYDVLVSPVLGHAPPPIGHLGPDVDFHTHLVRLLRYTSFTPVQNVSGSPALSLPLARTSTGLPLGIQLGAPFGDEATLLALAYELEEAAPWPTRAGRSSGLACSSRPRPRQ